MATGIGILLTGYSSIIKAFSNFAVVLVPSGFNWKGAHVSQILTIRENSTEMFLL